MQRGCSEVLRKCGNMAISMAVMSKLNIKSGMFLISIKASIEAIHFVRKA